MHHSEHDTEINKFVKIISQNIRSGNIPDMVEIEIGMREAALKDGSKGLSELLSMVPDYQSNRIYCNVCLSPMKLLRRNHQQGVF